MLSSSFANGRLDHLERLNLTEPASEEIERLRWYRGGPLSLPEGCQRILDSMTASSTPLSLTHLYMSRCLLRSYHMGSSLGKVSSRRLVVGM